MQNNCKNKCIKFNKTLNFSRWSRKSYAVFVSIGKIVKISNLKIEVSQDFIKKNKTFSAIQAFFNVKSNIQDEVLPDIVELIKSDVIQLQSIILSNSKNCNLSLVQLFNSNYCKKIICVNFIYAFFYF